MAEISPLRTAAETLLIERFPALKALLPGNDAVVRLRQTAFDSFAASGLPSRRVEAWKYTDLRALVREAPPPAPDPTPADLAQAQERQGAFGALEVAQITFVNGVLVGGLVGTALPKGVSMVRLADALVAGHPLMSAHLGKIARAEDPALALNGAFMTDGLIIEIAAGAKLDRPLALRFMNPSETAYAVFPRVLMVVGEGASVTLLEEHHGADGVAYQSNAVVEIVAGNHTHVSHVRLNRQGSKAIDLSTLGVALGGHARFTGFGFVSRPAVSRHQIFVRCAGEHSHLSLGGAAMLTGRQHADTTLVLDHAVPHCESRELYKNVLDGESTGVFQGKIIVAPHAQKTDGRMMSQAVLLADGAAMNNKPELEIFADDVQCAHGATCGQLDDDLLFYLRSRGLPRPDAEALMLQAFVGEAIELIEDEPVRDVLNDLAAQWLRARV
jgi:Fe-S cluster assembly protein SufD